MDLNETKLFTLNRVLQTLYYFCETVDVSIQLEVKAQAGLLAKLYKVDRNDLIQAAKLIVNTQAEEIWADELRIWLESNQNKPQ